MNGLKPWQQEKHYIQSVILNAISEYPLVFKGGTYLWFFHGLRRFSEDLDFTASEALPDDLPQKTSTVLELFGIENELKVMTNNEKTLSFRISANGPLNTGEKDRCVVYVEVSRREPILGKEIPLRFDLPEYQLPLKHLLGMGLGEVGAEKVRTILMRRKARDVYDLYHLISKAEIKFDNGLIDKKLSYYHVKFSKSGFMDAVREKGKYYSKELSSIVFGELPEFKEVERIIRGWIA